MLVGQVPAQDLDAQAHVAHRLIGETRERVQRSAKGLVKHVFQGLFIDQLAVWTLDAVGGELDERGQIGP